MHMNPYHMWREQSPRQVFELMNSYREMHKESDKGSGGTKENYTVKSKKKPKIPDWYTVPEGAEVYHADEVFEGSI